jgi:hypothetical protein
VKVVVPALSIRTRSVDADDPEGVVESSILPGDDPAPGVPSTSARITAAIELRSTPSATANRKSPMSSPSATMVAPPDTNPRVLARTIKAPPVSLLFRVNEKADVLDVVPFI